MARGRGDKRQTHRRHSREPPLSRHAHVAAGDHRYPPNSGDHRYPPNAVDHRYPSNADVVIDERIAAQQREIQTLLVDNQRIAASHFALRQELSAAQKDYHMLLTVASDVQRERDTQVRELYERSIMMEAELRSMNAHKGELSNVEAEIQKLSSVKQELTEKLEAVHGELSRLRVRSDFKERVEISEEIEAVRREILQGRLAIEQEKKNCAINLRQRNIMEKHMFSVARQIVELQSKLANAEKRARDAAAAPDPGYGASHGSHELAYAGNSNPDQYERHQFQNPSGNNPNSEEVS
ncbi:protein FLC EXPRESSOR-like [Impatiens glandulifera]|uniref:protein FLC EXPRESSOR-like n=1 Tax=Impatiens glandulifera TaxID=253017 RepID=UPI001FB095A2|nr:protein FLC EXPRESSOR-like [Impatiens glandulifera]